MIGRSIKKLEFRAVQSAYDHKEAIADGTLIDMSNRFDGQIYMHQLECFKFLCTCAFYKNYIELPNAVENTDYDQSARVYDILEILQNRLIQGEHKEEFTFAFEMKVNCRWVVIEVKCVPTVFKSGESSFVFMLSEER